MPILTHYLTSDHSTRFCGSEAGYESYEPDKVTCSACIDAAFIQVSKLKNRLFVRKIEISTSETMKQKGL